MHIDPLEKKWVFVALAMCSLFVTIIMIDALFHGVNAPSNVETIDSRKIHLSEEFAEDNLGVEVADDGEITIRMVAGRYAFFPKEITIPAETKVTFRWVSMDVLHGVHMPMTNMSTMVVPGYVAQIESSFPRPGEYPMVCNEYCGLGHDHMWSKVNVIDKEEWDAERAVLATADNDAIDEEQDDE